MSKKKILVVAIVFLLLGVSLVRLSGDSVWSPKQDETIQISFIARGKKTESWSTIEQGIEQAANDLNVEITPIYLSSENDASEQISLLNREVQNGADAVLIAPANSEDLRAPIEEAQKQVPVVAIESTVAGMETLPYIGCDNVSLGQALGEEILASGGKGTKVAILQNSLSCSSVKERYQGVLEVLQQYGMELSFWEIPDDPTQAYETAKTLLQRQDVNKAVALDGATLEAVARAEKELSPPGVTTVDIYGVGRTNQVVSYLEEKVITSIGVQNEFNIGYLGVKAAVDQIQGNEAESATINFAHCQFCGYVFSRKSKAALPICPLSGRRKGRYRDTATCKKGTVCAIGGGMPCALRFLRNQQPRTTDRNRPDRRGNLPQRRYVYHSPMR